MKICFLLSNHHKYVVDAILEEKGFDYSFFDIVVLGMAVSARNLRGARHVYVQTQPNGNFLLTIISMRKHIQELDELIGSRKVSEVWCPNQGMYLINSVLTRFEPTIMSVIGFEDGLGAYANGGMLDFRYGASLIIKRMICLLVLFPRFRFRRYGFKNTVDELWLFWPSLYSGPVPSRKILNIDHSRYKASVVSSGDKSALNFDLLFVGSPMFSEMSDSKKRQWSNELCQRLMERNKMLRVLYKPHPREKLESFSFIKEAFDRRGVDVELYNGCQSLESVFFSGNFASVYSMASTFLYVVKAYNKTVEVYCDLNGVFPMFRPQFRRFFKGAGVVEL